MNNSKICARKIIFGVQYIENGCKGLEISDFLLGLLSGGFLIIVSQIIGHYFARKNLEAQQKHGLRVVKMQLFHGDRKEALIELDKLLKAGYKRFGDFRNTVESFLNSSLALFLPDDLRTDLKKEIQNIDQFLFEKQIEFEGPPPEFDEEEHEAWIQSLNPYEAVDVEVRDRLGRLKRSMRDRIRKSVSEE